MSQKCGINNNKVLRLVLTGGPCGGKSTGQARLCTFFENLGWKVYRVPETATVLLSGGVKFSDLSEDEAYHFQENLVKTMMQIEQTYFDLAQASKQHTMVVCDRGIMDASAYVKPELWERMKRENSWNEVDLRDNRYNQVIHMVSAAKGAEAFYTTSCHAVRHEDLYEARKLDDMTSQAWVGHPYFDVIDNSTDFERKLMRMLKAVCSRISIDAEGRLSPDSKKRKFLISSFPDESLLPQHRCFTVIHNYLVTPTAKMQARIRKRGEKGNWTYTHTIREPEINEESPERRMQITSREYEILLAQRDANHSTIRKRRWCFLWNDQYFQMDVYKEPCPTKCKGLIILETYTTLTGEDLKLPDFLDVVKEITDDPDFSMYSLSKVDEQNGVVRSSSFSKWYRTGNGVVAKPSNSSVVLLRAGYNGNVVDSSATSGMGSGTTSPKARHRSADSGSIANHAGGGFGGGVVVSNGGCHRSKSEKGATISNGMDGQENGKRSEKKGSMERILNHDFENEKEVSGNEVKNGQSDDGIRESTCM